MCYYFLGGSYRVFICLVRVAEVFVQQTVRSRWRRGLLTSVKKDRDNTHTHTHTHTKKKKNTGKEHRSFNYHSSPFQPTSIRIHG
jgi:hypothetical protein